MLGDGELAGKNGIKQLKYAEELGLGSLDYELAYINSIHFLTDLIEIITRAKPHIYVCAVDLERLNIIKNNSGGFNVQGKN